jgi:hypothetical protein
VVLGEAGNTVWRCVMVKKSKRKIDPGRIRERERRDLDRKIKESDNRRALLKKLDPDTAEFTRREFAKLGLY